MPICRTIVLTRRSGFVPFVATRRIRSDTFAVGLSGRAFLDILSKVGAAMNPCVSFPPANLQALRVLN